MAKIQNDFDVVTQSVPFQAPALIEEALLPDDWEATVYSVENLTTAGRLALKNGVIRVGDVREIQRQLENAELEVRAVEP